MSSAQYEHYLPPVSHLTESRARTSRGAGRVGAIQRDGPDVDPRPAPRRIVERPADTEPQLRRMTFAQLKEQCAEASHDDPPAPTPRRVTTKPTGAGVAAAALGLLRR